MKAHYWFATQAALEYIICVRIEKDKDISLMTCKVYDIAACKGVFLAQPSYRRKYRA